MTKENNHIVFISLGTNLGFKEHNLKTAIALIGQKIGIIAKVSSIYKTAPWGYHDQPEFLNQVVQVSTLLSPNRVMELLLEIEERMGRKRTFKNASRIIDLDILFFDDAILKTKNLIIPHPFISERKFILIPLLEIAPDLTHPEMHQTLKGLYENCKDSLSVVKCGDNSE